MKTAISVPDFICSEVERRASELGVSRSEFYATAARLYLNQLDSASLTQRIDDLLERIEPDDSLEVAVVLGRATLGAGDDSSLPRNLSQNQTFTVLF